MSEEKKTKLADLPDEQKKKIKRNALKIMVATAVICIILSGCFACTNEPASPELSEEQKAAQQKTYWSALISDSSWTVLTDTSNDGILKGNVAAMDIGISLDQTTGNFRLEYRMGPMTLPMGNLTLTGTDGTIATSGSDTWTAHFSESSTDKYMTVTDSDSKAVYYKMQ